MEWIISLYSSYFGLRLRSYWSCLKRVLLIVVSANFFRTPVSPANALGKFTFLLYPSTSQSNYNAHLFVVLIFKMLNGLSNLIFRNELGLSCSCMYSRAELIKPKQKIAWLVWLGVYTGWWNRPIQLKPTIFHLI